MIASVFRVMLLGVLRDRGAFAMAFVLPPLIYVIFASIFSVAAGGDLRVKVAIVDQAGTEASRRLADALRQSSDIRVSAEQPADTGRMEEMVRRGEIDAGIVIRHDPAGVENSAGAPVRIVGDFEPRHRRPDRDWSSSEVVRGLPARRRLPANCIRH